MSKRKKQPISVWQALNQPVVEVSDESAKGIFLVAAVVLMMAWMMPGFGEAKAMSNVQFPMTNQEIAYYQPLFDDMPYENVAGESIEIIPASTGAITETFAALSATGASLGEFYQETVSEPFKTAAVELLDISEPVQGMVEFYEPGVDAVWDAWIELMQDPVY